MSEIDEELFLLMTRIRDKVAATIDLVEQSNYDALPGTKTTLLAYKECMKLLDLLALRAIKELSNTDYWWRVDWVVDDYPSHTGYPSLEELRQQTLELLEKVEG